MTSALLTTRPRLEFGEGYVLLSEHSKGEVLGLQRLDAIIKDRKDSLEKKLALERDRVAEQTKPDSNLGMTETDNDNI